MCSVSLTFPISNFYRSDWPAFMETLDEQEPWDEEPCFLRLLHDAGSKASFFKPDVWHTINLGVGRSWLSNCIVMLIDTLPDLKQMTQEEVLEFLSNSYIDFCESSEPFLTGFGMYVFLFVVVC